MIELLPFAPKKPYRAKTRQVRLRLTVDGRSEEFWLEELDPAHMRCGDHQQRRTASERVVAGTGRRVAATMAPYSVELGFDVYLREFERRLDPGTSMASKYSSLVDLYGDSKAESRRDESAASTDAAAGKVLAKDLLINLNAPQDVRDPFTGRSYRLFQESFSGPWKPGDAEFDSMVAPQSDRSQLFLSTLSVNYDPGRGVKYVGCADRRRGDRHVLYGAYFFRRRKAVRPVKSAGAPEEPSSLPRIRIWSETTSAFHDPHHGVSPCSRERLSWRFSSDLQPERWLLPSSRWTGMLGSTCRCSIGAG